MFSKDAFHHAYFIEGEKQAVLADIESFLDKAFGIARRGNPDVHVTEYESFGIDESRTLQDMQLLRPVVGDKKIFIVTLNAITSEAQNSLLKVFEEPTPGTHFFVVASSQRILLPTLRSRVVVITHDSARQKKDLDIQKFLTLSAKERLAYVAPLIEEKDKARAEEFLNTLVTELHTQGKMKTVKEIVPFIGYLKDRAPSLKLILERVALLDF